MRWLSLFLVSLSASLVSSISLSDLGVDQTTLSESFDVPGENPLKFCADPKDYIVHINNVDLDPNPPQKGKSLNITASGVLSQDVEAGATVALTVKYGLITLISQTADLCDQVAQVGLDCPLKKGDLSLSRQVDIPGVVPGGQYTVISDVLTKDGEKVTCLKSVVYF